MAMVNMMLSQANKRSYQGAAHFAMSRPMAPVNYGALQGFGMGMQQGLFGGFGSGDDQGYQDDDDLGFLFAGLTDNFQGNQSFGNNFPDPGYQNYQSIQSDPYMPPMMGDNFLGGSLAPADIQPVYNNYNPMLGSPS